MTGNEIDARAFALPTNPAFPPGPYRLVDREYLIVTYRTDYDALRVVVPEPLQTSRSSRTGSSACPTPRGSATTPRQPR